MPRGADADPLRRTVGSGQWVRRLGSADPEERAGAAWLLGRYDGASPRAETVSGLREMLGRESDSRAMLAAVGALAAMDQPASAEVLRALVLDGRSGLSSAATEVAASAVRALGQWPGEDGTRWLIRVARPAPSGALRVDLSEAAVLALADLPYAEFEQLMVGTRSSPQDRAVALRAAGFRGDARWARVIAEHLALPVRAATAAAIEATVRLRLTENAPSVIEIARNGRERAVRRAAVRALGALGGGYDPSVLREFMSDPVTREAAFESAGALGDPALVGDVAGGLGASWAGDRAAAVEALGAIGGPTATAALLEGFRGADESTREALWHALSRCGASARGPIATAPDEGAAHWARVELWARDGVRPGRGVATGQGAAALRVRALAGESIALDGLSSASSDVRAATAMALGDGRTASDALIARLAREDHEGVRTALVMALGAVGDARAREALVALVTREAAEPTVAARAAASELGALGEFAAAPALREMTRGRDPEARAIARWALGAMHDPQAIGDLEAAAVMEADVWARGTALVALARLWGVGARPALRWASRTSGSARMDAMVSYAENIVRAGGAGVFVGGTVVRVSGAAPGSVWAIELPDGGARFGVAAEDGVVLLIGAPADENSLRRVW